MNEWIKKAPELKGQNIKQMINDYKIIREHFTERGKNIFQNYLRMII